MKLSGVYMAAVVCKIVWNTHGLMQSMIRWSTWDKDQAPLGARINLRSKKKYI